MHAVSSVEITICECIVLSPSLRCDPAARLSKEVAVYKSLLSILFATFSLFLVASPAQAMCTKVDLGKFETEDCGGTRRIEKGSGPDAASYEVIERQFKIGPNNGVKSGSHDPGCHSSVVVIGIPFNYPSSCATFCVEGINDDPSRPATISFLMWDSSQGDLFNCGNDVCIGDWSSSHRKEGFACAEFRNWKHDRTRTALIRVRRLEH